MWLWGIGGATLLLAQAPCLGATRPALRGQLGAARGPAHSGGSPRLGCPVCGPPTPCGSVPPDLPELSGLAASQVHRGHFYAVNDSPAGPSISVIKETGEVVQSIALTGIARVGFGKTGWGDWEDIAVGPCFPGSAKSCVFVADIGQNCANKPTALCPWTREIQSIIRFEEPALGSALTVSAPAQRLWFTYPESTGLQHNSESFAVTPAGDFLVVTKDRSQTSLVFSLEGLGPAANVTAKLLTEVKKPLGADKSKQFTAADVRVEDGVISGLTLLTYTDVVHIPLEPDQPLDQLRTAEFCPMRAALEHQDEALGWEAVNGSFFLVGSEGVGSIMWKVRCSTSAVGRQP